MRSEINTPHRKGVHSTMKLIKEVIKKKKYKIAPVWKLNLYVFELRITVVDELRITVVVAISQLPIEYL